MSTRPSDDEHRAQDRGERQAVPERPGRRGASARCRAGSATRGRCCATTKRPKTRPNTRNSADAGEQDGAEHVGVVDRLEPEPVGPDAGEDRAEEQQHRQRDERRHQHPAPPVRATGAGSGRGRGGPKMSLTWLLVAGRVAGSLTCTLCLTSKFCVRWSSSPGTRSGPSSSGASSGSRARTALWRSPSRVTAATAAPRGGRVLRPRTRAARRRRRAASSSASGGSMIRSTHRGAPGDGVGPLDLARAGPRAAGRPAGRPARSDVIPSGWASAGRQLRRRARARAATSSAVGHEREQPRRLVPAVGRHVRLDLERDEAQRGRQRATALGLSASGHRRLRVLRPAPRARRSRRRASRS